MKRLVSLLLLAGLAFAAGARLMVHRQATRYPRELDAQRVAWEAEKADLEIALAQANIRANQRLVPTASVVVDAPSATPRKPKAEEILEKLKTVRIAPGPGQKAAARQAIVLFNALAELGPDGLPAIRRFLALNQDMDYEAHAGGKGLRDIKSVTDSVLPVSLRLGLFDVLPQIGGGEAQELLANVLTNTGRGVEVAYLARVLDGMAPGKYTETALIAARDLLAQDAPVSDNTLDRFDRDYLYALLKLHGDTSYVSTAQSQLIQPDGKVDRSALKYLQHALGAETVPIIARAYQDPRLKEQEREPLARVALSYVGADPQAEQFFHASIFDPALSLDRRRELIHDLDQDGLIIDKIPTPADVPIIASRYELTQAYLQQDYIGQDQPLQAAFLKAAKDLLKLLERAAAAGASPATIPTSPGK